MKRRLSLLIAVLLFPMLLVTLLFATSRTQAAPTADDVCAVGCMYSTIQGAVDSSLTGSTLNIAAETFTENVEITRSITLVGAGPGLTIVDGQMTDTVFLISDGATVSISNLTIQNGDNSSSEGGGVTNEGSTVTLSNLIVENNKALDGAGIANDGTMIISDTTVRNNAADEIVAGISICSDCTGGGIYNTSVMTITNSFIYSNTAQFGGGLVNGAASSLSATDIEVYGNIVATNPSDPSASGGGIENSGAFTLTNSIIHDNVALIGGGIVNEGTLTMMNSNLYANTGSEQGGGLHNTFNATIQTSNFYDNVAGSGGGGGISSIVGTILVEQTAVYNNSATGSGGGILHNVDLGAGNNSFTLRNSTISGNSTSGAGGGIRNAGIAETKIENVTLANNTAVINGRSIDVQAGTLTIQNSIINSASPSCSGAITSDGYNIANDGSCDLTGTADLPNTNPSLGALQNNGGSTLTHALMAGSPAIDSGSNSGCPAIDQRGVARPFNMTCDRGAYEFDQALQSLYLPLIIRP